MKPDRALGKIYKNFAQNENKACEYVKHITGALVLYFTSTFLSSVCLTALCPEAGITVA